MIHVSYWPHHTLAPAEREVVPFISGEPLRYYLPAKARELEASVLARIDDRVAGLDAVPHDRAHVSFVVVPGGAEAGFLAAFYTGTAAASATAAAAATAAAQAALLLKLGTAALYLAATYVVNLLLGPNDPAKRKGDESSRQYSFSGLQNQRNEGGAREIILGEIGFAPTIVDEFISVGATPDESFYNVLLCFGEGPVTKIGNQESDTASDVPLDGSTDERALKGLRLNGNPIDNYHDYQAWVRLGSNGQAAIPHFEYVHGQHSVGATLDQLELGDTSYSTTDKTFLEPLDPGSPTVVQDYYNDNTTDTQDVWDEFAHGFDLDGRDNDGFVATVGFPGGLYRVGSSGNLGSAFFEGLFRYQRLGNGGEPIDIGGDNDDGWVYCLPTSLFEATSQDELRVQFAYDFYDPIGYSAPGIGFCLTSPGSPDRAYVTDPTVPAEWSAGSKIPEFTFETWFKTPTTGTTVQAIFSWQDNSDAGIAVTFERQGYVSAFGGVSLMVPTVRLGDGTTVREVYELPPGFPDSHVGSTGPWYHVAVTYKRNADGADDRIRIYFAGELVQESYGTYELEAPAVGSAFEFGRALHFPSSTYSTGRWDESRVWETERTAEEIRNSYFFNRGTFGSDESTLVAGYHFDSQSISPDETPDYSSNGNDLTRSVSTVEAGATEGKVFGAPTGTLRAGKYRVQAIRANFKHDSVRVQDEARWESIDGVIYEQLQYPNKPLLGLRIRASDQLNTNAPLVTVDVRGQAVPVWDGAIVSDQWTRNPVWNLLGLASNSYWGMGSIFPIGGFTKRNLDEMLEWAEACDAKVYDGREQVEVQDVLYQTTVSGAPQYDDRGRLLVYLGSNPPPSHWRAESYAGAGDGYRVRFSGLPVPTSSIDVNVPPQEGYEIAFSGAIGLSGSSYAVIVYYRDYGQGSWTAPWTSGTNLSADISPTPIAGVVEGVEPRFQLDAVLDNFEPAWDWLISLAATARGTPMLTGNLLRFRYNGPRSAVGHIGKANTLPGSIRVEYGSPKNRKNSYVIEIWDETNRYAVTPVTVNADGLETVVEEQIRREQMSLRGVVRRSQATRHGKFLLKVNELVTRSIECEVGPEMIGLEVGDVVRVGHDIVPWGTHTRVVSSSATDEAELAAAVTVSASEATYLSVVFPSGAIETQEIDDGTTGTGTIAAGATITTSAAFAETPTKDCPAIVYTASQEALFEVVEVSTTPDLRRKVMLVKYDGDVYDVDTLDDGELA